ncbi:MAG TPA: DUF192 domain-containing protein [Bryobacteraceae bacterium]|nr:DUF192 domain-containing protein [Bryobacteraceae bacterium]
MRFFVPVLMVICFSLSCSRTDDSSSDQASTTAIGLPDGTEIRAEVLTKSVDMEHGMMYRDALPQGRGLLFVHQRPAYLRYWMANVKAPLDIIFMDTGHKIMEISADTPICTTKPEDCLTYGGHHLEQFVLELRAGEARRLGLHEGQTLRF